jgi:hypothetical protein
MWRYSLRPDGGQAERAARPLQRAALFYLNRKRISILRETHDTPESVTRRLRLAGGVNRFGEPLYRAVWGWNRLTYIGGKWTDYDTNTGLAIRERVELRREPKYPQRNRWHIEKWLPPESYGSPLAWYAQTLENANGQFIPALGPYPVRGEYEHCFTLETPGGEFLQLTPTVAEYIALAIERSRNASRFTRKVAIRDREHKADDEYGNWAYDVLDDAVPAFSKQPFVTVA